MKNKELISLDEKQWIETSINQSDFEIELIHEHEFCNIIKIITQNQLYYFKHERCDLNETKNVNVLNNTFPSFYDCLINYDIHNRRILTKHCGDYLLINTHSKNWSQAIELLANFHQESHSKLAEIKSQFREQKLNINPLKSIFSNNEQMQYWEIKKEQVESILNHQEYLESLYQKIHNEIPFECICHGDAHARNHFVDEQNKGTWIDWDNAHLGHPITDIGFFLWWISLDRSNIGATINLGNEFRENLFQEYKKLMGWEHLTLSLEQVKMVSLAHRIELYHQKFKKHTSFKNGFVKYVTGHLVKLLLGMSTLTMLAG